MSVRLHVVVDESERDAFRAEAAHQGVSLSEWLRQAARDRLGRSRPPRLRTRADLEAFFAEIDQRHSEDGPEPDWDEHLKVIERSRLEGLELT
jgi:hypothetical protein